MKILAQAADQSRDGNPYIHLLYENLSAAGGEAIIAIGATEVAPLRTVGPGVVASRVAWQAGGAKLGGRARLRLTPAPGGVVYAFELV